MKVRFFLMRAFLPLLFLSCIFFSCFGFLNAQSPAEEAAMEKLDAASIAYREERFQLSLDLIQEGLELVPNSAPLYYLQGQSRFAMGAYKSAKKSFRRAWKYKPADPATGTYLGVVALHREKRRQSLRWLNKALEADSTFYRASQILGGLYRAMGKPLEAERAFEQGIRHYPLDPGLYCALGDLYLSQARYNEAIRTLTIGIQADGSFARLYELRGQAHYFKEDFYQAAKDFLYLGSLSPGTVYPELGEGLKAVFTSQVAAAIPAFQDALEIDPHCKFCLYVLGRAQLEQPAVSMDSVQAVLDRLNALEGKFTVASNLEAALLYKSGQAQKALKVARKHLKRYPKDLSSWRIAVKAGIAISQAVQDEMIRKGMEYFSKEQLIPPDIPLID